MFQGCFTYDYKGPCYIYCPETNEQKEYNEELIEELNDNKIEAECREAFAKQEREKEEKWDKLGRKQPKNRASWESYWKKNQFKKGPSHGGVDNIRYTYEVIEPHLIPFFKGFMLQRHDPDTLEYDQPSFVFQQDNAPSHASKQTLRRCNIRSKLYSHYSHYKIGRAHV